MGTFTNFIMFCVLCGVSLNWLTLPVVGVDMTPFVLNALGFAQVFLVTASLPLVGLFVLYLFFVLDDENNNTLTATFVTSAVIYFRYSEQLSLNFLLANVQLLTLVVLCYILIGCLWAVIKIKFYVETRKFNERIQAYAKRTKRIVSLENRGTIATDYYRANYDIFVSWIMFWPVSILNTIFLDIVQNFLNYFAGYFIHVISDAMVDVFELQPTATTTSTTHDDSTDNLVHEPSRTKSPSRSHF